MDLKGKKVTIIGLGNSGANAALLAKDAGADVRATDCGNGPELKKTKLRLQGNGIEVELGRHTESFVKGSELVVVSPGVEDKSAAVKWAEKSKIPIISEMEFGYSFCKGKIIAITGTNGKSTVTELVGKILKCANMDTVVCGNIGNSLCGEISRIREKTWVVLEVSSAQLERVKNFKPNIALILNITDDHMDRYRNFYEYFNAKLKIFARQDHDDTLILNYDAQNLRNLKGLSKAKVYYYAKETGYVNGYHISAYMKDAKVFCAYDSVVREVLSYGDIKLKGLHNLENVIAACFIAVVVGVSAESIREAVSNFSGLEHRFEKIDTIGGVDYIDDSKGTTVDSTKRALESCVKPVVLIAGGKDKRSDYSIVKDAVAKKVKNLILLGEASKAIRKAIGNVTRTQEVKTMAEAVQSAHRLAQDGWIVLLSPMCSSFDMFNDYKERGNIFKEEVSKLKGSNQAVKA